MIMAAAKKSNALQVAREKLQDTQKKLVSNRKEAQQKINSLKVELKQKVSDALAQGYEKGLSEAFKEKEKYLQAREKAVMNAISKFDKGFKSKVEPTKSATKKPTAKKAVTKKAITKKPVAKKAAPKKSTAKKKTAKK